MPDSEDYRKYLEEKFDSLHAKLDTIVEQVKKTNGTTIELAKEDRRIECKVDEGLSWAHHVVDTRSTECPLLPRIEEVEDGLKENADLIKKEVESLREELLEWRFFKRYPKLSLVLVAIVVTSIIVSMIGTFETIGNKRRGKDIIQNQQQIQNQVRSIQKYDPFDTTKKDSADAARNKRLLDMSDKLMEKLK
jgi:hypothetical protein